MNDIDEIVIYAMNKCLRLVTVPFKNLTKEERIEYRRMLNKNKLMLKERNIFK